MAEHDGVRFIRDDVKCTNSQMCVIDGSSVVDEYKRIISSGFIVSSLILCKDGSIMFYVEDGECQEVTKNMEDGKIEVAMAQP